MSYGEGVYGEGVYGDITSGVTFQAAHGVVTFTGYTPTMQLAPAMQAFIGQIDVAGYAPTFHNGFRMPAQQGAVIVTGYAPTFLDYSPWRALRGDVAIAGYAPSLALFFANQGAIDFAGYEPRFVAGFVQQATRGQIVVAGYAPTLVVRSDRPISDHWISTHYRCVLTGAPDGLADLPLPLKSFQTRYGASPFRIYLSVVVPGVDQYIDAINARPNGRLHIDRIYNYLSGVTESYLMAESPIDTIATNQGGQSGTTGTLSGYEQMTPVNALTLTLYDPITRSSDSGRRRYRCRLDPRVRPLDTVTINNETFQVDQVIHVVDVSTAIMEVQELIA